MGALVEKIGQRIRLLRQEAGLTMAQASERVGMDGIYWGRVERGEKNVTLGSIERMIEALDIPPLELFAFIETPEEGDERILINLLPRMSPEAVHQLVGLARFLARPE